MADLASSLISMGLRWEEGELTILDQTLLPHEERWLLCDSVNDLVEAIQRLAIRGAPAIGISSVLLLATLAMRGASPTELAEDAARLRKARPTAVNLMNNIDRLLTVLDSPGYPESVVAEAQAIYHEDRTLCDCMAEYGAALIGEGERILTHCNTGGLATAGIGTAMGVIRRAHAQGKNPFVWVDETRPLLQGGRLTAWECGKLGIRHAIICDSAAAMLMQRAEVDKVLVGSDRIAANGDFANKIGTYSLAVLAAYHRIPFYVVAPCTTIDTNCATGAEIEIEERSMTEVRGVAGAQGNYQWAPQSSPAFNPAFDVTPAELVTGWVLDRGVYTLSDFVGEDFGHRLG